MQNKEQSLADLESVKWKKSARTIARLLARTVRKTVVGRYYFSLCLSQGKTYVMVEYREPNYVHRYSCRCGIKMSSNKKTLNAWVLRNMGI